MAMIFLWGCILGRGGIGTTLAIFISGVFALNDLSI